MSYPRDLDEYTTAELKAELAKREEANKQGLCDYCHRPWNTPACRYPDRHAGRGGILTIFVNGQPWLIGDTYLSYQKLVAIADLSENRLWCVTCHYPSTGHNCIVAPREYVTVREGMRVEISNTGAA